jgi:predicted component of viral defense system (DUF524 family)
MNAVAYSAKYRAVIFEEGDDPIREDVEAFLPMDAALDEWKTYFLKFYDDVPDAISHYARASQNKMRLRKLPGNVFELNFQNYVGRSRILDITVNVQSRKISPDEYDRMLQFITERYASLIFSFDTPTGLGYAKESADKDHAYLAFLFLKHFLLNGSPDIDAITGLILSNPHHRFQEETQTLAIERAGYLSSADLMASVSTAGYYGRVSEGHPLTMTSLGRTLRHRTGQPLVLERVRQTQKFITHDTHENRFLKFFLDDLRQRIELIRSLVAGTNGTFLNPAIEEEAQTLSEKIDHLLSAPLWSEVGTLTAIPESSTVLQSRSGYRELFRLYSLLQLATHYQFSVDDIRDIIESKDLPLLYEYWCLFLTMDALQAELGMPLEVRDVTEMRRHEQRVPNGLEIRYRRQVTLHFNLSCSARSGAQHSSYSHGFYPDIVVSREARKVIFDAKAKGKRGDFWGEESEGQIGKYKDEDIDKMHTYREAINDVFGAYILYPGTTTKFFRCPNGRSAFEGVGAIALKPGDSKSGVEQIRNAISDFLHH